MVAGRSNVSKHPSTKLVWQPAPKKKKEDKDKPKNSLQKAKERHDRIEDLINEM